MHVLRSLFVRLDVGHLVTLLLVVFSGVYLTKTGVSPVYLTTLMGLVGMAALWLAAGGGAPASAWAQAIGTVLLMVPVALHQISLESGAGNVVNLVLGPILVALIPMAGRQLRRDQLVSISWAFVLSSLGVTAIESAYRLTHPDLGFLEETSQRDDAEDLAFYALKFNSLMYIDSNFVGLQLAVLFGFLLGLQRMGVHVSRRWQVATFVLTVATLSRASIFAILFVIGIEVYRRVVKGIVLKFLASVVAVAAVLGAFYAVQNDTSFATKFDILHRFIAYLGRADEVRLLFGLGAGHAKHALAIGAHNLVVTYVVELGLVLTVVLFGYWMVMAWNVPATRYMLLAWLVNGFSLTTLAVPYMYASAALLMLLNRTSPSPTAPHSRVAERT